LTDGRARFDGTLRLLHIEPLDLGETDAPGTAPARDELPKLVRRLADQGQALDLVVVTEATRHSRVFSRSAPRSSARGLRSRSRRWLRISAA